MFGVFTKHTCVSTHTSIAYASLFGGDANHGAKKRAELTKKYLNKQHISYEK